MTGPDEGPPNPSGTSNAANTTNGHANGNENITGQSSGISSRTDNNAASQSSMNDSTDNMEGTTPVANSPIAASSDNTEYSQPSEWCPKSFYAYQCFAPSNRILCLASDDSGDDKEGEDQETWSTDGNPSDSSGEESDADDNDRGEDQGSIGGNYYIPRSIVTFLYNNMRDTAQVADNSDSVPDLVPDSGTDDSDAGQDNNHEDN